MAWVVVDKDKTEWLFSGEPMRRRKLDNSKIVGALWGLIKNIRYTKNQYNKWFNGWSTCEEDPLPQFGVQVPQGTIEKIIGKQITWFDEPVELK
jgi:hypothetical protein